MHILINTKGPTGVHYSPKFNYLIKNRCVQKSIKIKFLNYLKYFSCGYNICHYLKDEINSCCLVAN